MICYHEHMSPTEIVKFRRRLGLTQATLADKLGVSFVTVNRWENDRSRPPANILTKLKTVEAALLSASKPEVKVPTASVLVDFLGNADRVRLLTEAERLSYQSFKKASKSLDACPNSGVTRAP